MSFCSLVKGITPKIRMLCFVLINSVILNLLVLCVWVLNCSLIYSFTRKDINVTQCLLLGVPEIVDIDGHPVPPKNVTGCHFSPDKSGYDISCPDGHRIAPVGYVFFFKTPEIQQSQKCISCTEGYCTDFFDFLYKCFVSVLLQLLQIALYWTVQARLLTPSTFTRHRLSPLAAFISGAYFLHNGRR